MFQVTYFRQQVESCSCHAWVTYPKNPEIAFVNIQSVFWGFVFPRVSYTKIFQIFSYTSFFFLIVKPLSKKLGKDFHLLFFWVCKISALTTLLRLKKFNYKFNIAVILHLMV